MYSIYHFFAHLMKNKQRFRDDGKLEEFPFDKSLLSCDSKGKFPDLAIRLDPDSTIFSGGELIDLKDSKGYGVSSFNSTIPTGQKDIRRIIPSTKSKIYRQMIAAGDDVFSLPIRDVFYLVRGRHRGHVKVCLVHGSFFETVKVEDLIKQAFSQVLDERILATNLEIEAAVKDLLAAIFTDQASFSKVRNIVGASVKPRFRIMAEVKAEGNILNSDRYPDIRDNTLNLVIPCYSSTIEEQANARVKIATGDAAYDTLHIFKIKHWLNGEFLVFQTEIGEQPV